MDDSGNILAFATFFYLIVSVLTAQIAVHNPSVQQITGLTPASQIDACQDVGPRSGLTLTKYGETGGLEWPGGGLFGNANLNNVQIQQNNIVLSSGATSGSYTLSGISFPAAGYVTQVETNATVGSSASITYTIATEESQISFAVPDGASNQSVDFKYPDHETGSVTLEVSLSRQNASDPAPVLDSTTWRGFETEAIDRNFVGEVLGWSNCAVRVAFEYATVIFISTGNVYIDIIFNGVGTLLLLAFVAYVSMLVSRVPIL